MVIKVVGAELNRSFDSFGKMDPFAVVHVVEPDGSLWEMARTTTDWGGHMTPSWNHTCRGILYRGKNGGGGLRFQVFEKNFGDVGTPTFCGEASLPAHELVEEVAGKLGEWTMVHRAKLMKNSEETGIIMVQAFLSMETETDGVGFSLVDARKFLSPARSACPEACLSGFPCYALKLRAPQESELPDRWIGRDASAGFTEIPFYERRRTLVGTGLENFFEFMLDYAGVVECPVEGAKTGGQPKKMMVLENLTAGNEAFRMLDIKIGEQAVHSKETGSLFGVLRQSLRDGMRLEANEGFYLETFLGQPHVLRSRNPLIHTLCEGNKTMREMATRLMLQRMHASEMFMHFVDVHLSPAATIGTGKSISTLGRASSVIVPSILPMDKAEIATTLSPTELSELALSEVVRQLARLALTCRRAEAPQNWRQSSVALSFDCGRALPRSNLKEGLVDDRILRDMVKVRIHNWGCSDLTTKEGHTALSVNDRKERGANWRCYTRSMFKLAWEAARAYRHRFSNAGQWKEAIVTVLDFDSTSADDVIGSARLPLQPTEQKTVPLMDKSGQNAGEATITYSMEFREFPQGARLRGVWCVKILRASNLLVCDKLLGTSDPYASMCVVSEDGAMQMQQNTAVIARDLNPKWNETFEFPLAAAGRGVLDQLLDTATAGLGSQANLDKMLPAYSTDGSTGEAERALQLWVEHFTVMATTTSRSGKGGA